MSFGFGFGFPKNYIATLFNPAQLFTGTTNGAWYDPSDVNLTWRRNLLTYSEQFDNAAWTRAATSVTPNSAVAPDGTLTADTLTATSASGYVFPTSGIFANAAGATFTYSVYVKENTSTTYTLLCTSAVNYTATYNLSTGVASGVSANAQASITPVGGGWFRLTLTLNSVPSQAYTEFQNGRLANGTSVYIWGAQLELGSTATPYQRITDGIKDYLDYKPLPILYQDAAGTTPVTAVGQPVGLMLDKSKGLVLGPELVTNGDFSGGTTGWTQAANSTLTTEASFVGRTNVAKTVNNSTTGVSNSQYLTGLVAGKTYKITAFAYAPSSNTQVNAAAIFTSELLSNRRNVTVEDVWQEISIIFTAAGSTTTLSFNAVAPGNLVSSGDVAYFDNISVRELPGNHAFNPSGNSANFPVLSARYNLLTKTEDFTAGGPWIPGTGVSVSNQKTITFTSGGNTEFVRQLYSFVSGITYTILIRAKSVSGNTTMSVDLENAQGVTDMILTTEFQVFQRQITPSAARAWMDIQLGGGGVVQIDYIDLRVSNDALSQPAYQRVNTDTDYDTVGFKPYLSFNGVNQWLQTNSIDFTYGDKMFVSAGVRKLSDATLGVIQELGNGSQTNIFGLWNGNPAVAAGARYAYVSGGTVGVSAGSPLSYASPITNVLSGIGNISAPSATLRVNGTQVAQSTASQGTGNYGNYPMYIGARAGSSLWLNGRLYQLIVADGGYNQYALEDDNLFLLEDGTAMLTEYGANPGPTVIAAVESFVNQKTGAY